MRKGLLRERRYMELALREAKKAEDRTYPNPMVGALIVKNDRIVSTGFHKKAGLDHAETAAIKNARGKNLDGAEMFVTLEPCGHYGKTPPCAKAIAESGIRKVHAAMRDPNPVTSGKGIEMLRKAGVKVKIGLCEKAARELNRKYLKYVEKGLPYVTVKLAQSLDGRIAAADGSSKWITSDTSRRAAGKMRSSFDAVIVGKNTVLADNPALFGTTRVVVDSRLEIPLGSKLIRTAEKFPVIVVTTDLSPRVKREKFSGIKGVEVVVAEKKNGRVLLRDLLGKMAKKGFVNVLVEGGGELAGGFRDDGLADEWLFFIAPKVFGGGIFSVRGKGIENISEAVSLSDVGFEKIGPDILVRGRTCSLE